MAAASAAALQTCVGKSDPLGEMSAPSHIATPELDADVEWVRAESLAFEEGGNVLDVPKKRGEIVTGSVDVQDLGQVDQPWSTVLVEDVVGGKIAVDQFAIEQYFDIEQNGFESRFSF